MGPAAQSPSAPVIPAASPSVPSIPELPSLMTPTAQKTKAAPKAKAAKPKKETDPRHKPYIEAWMNWYLTNYGVKYEFAGGRDGKNITTLLSYTAGDMAKMLAVATHMKGFAWQCKDGAPVTLSKLVSCWNEYVLKVGIASGTSANDPWFTHAAPAAQTGVSKYGW